MLHCAALDEKRPGSYTGPLDDNVVGQPTISLAGTQGRYRKREEHRQP